MRSRFGVLARGWAIFVGPPLVALLIGVAVAVALTPPSLGRTPGRGLATGRVDASPSPADPSPIPSVTSPGVLGDGPHLTLGSPGILGGSGANLSEVTSDAGKTWTALRPPSGAAGIGLDPSDPRHAISGGAPIQVTTHRSARGKTTP